MVVVPFRGSFLYPFISLEENSCHRLSHSNDRFCQGPFKMIPCSGYWHYSTQLIDCWRKSTTEMILVDELSGE